MSEAEARRRLASARVARLATVAPAGAVDLVPCTFALVGHTVVTAVDHKPKTTTQLKRLANVRAHPEVSLLVDHYDDADWSALWWVRVRGVGRVLEPEDPDHRGVVDALSAKYAQYVERPPAGPAIIVEVRRWQGWAGR